MTDTTVQNNLDAIKERLAKNPGMILESLQDGSALSMDQIIEVLPEAMWKRIDGQHFTDVLQKISAIGSVMTMMHTADVILEFKGPFPAGEFSHGFYNLKGEKVGLHGHLRPNRCKSIYFVERPFMKRTTASIVFINPEGNVMFKIFLGRDESGEICTKQLEVFRALAQLQTTEAST